MAISNHERVGRTMVAEADRKPIATASWERIDGVGLLRSVAVASEYRRAGAGTIIVAGTLKRMIEEGAREVYLVTENAERFFAACGFRVIDRDQLPEAIESHPQLEEAAADLYATPARRFRQITLPLMLPAVLAGALLAFSFSLDDTIISSFVSVAGASPWPVYVFSAVRNALRPEVASVSTLLLTLTLIAITSVALVLRRSGQSSKDVAKTMTVGG